MKLVVYLTVIVIKVFLFTPASQGVTCYYCKSEAQANGRMADITHKSNTSGARITSEDLPYDKACSSIKPKKTAVCQYGCAKYTETKGNKVVRACRKVESQPSGCEIMGDGEVCYCSTNLCNKSYLLSYLWTFLVASLGISIIFK